MQQLISYIAPGAPATRRPAKGNLPWLRPEIGFTPKWYRQSLDIDFGEKWHTDPDYREQTVNMMKAEIEKRFPNSSIAAIDQPEMQPDFLTGTFGACIISAMFGIPIVYSRDNWPCTSKDYLSADQIDNLEVPNLQSSEIFQNLLGQLEKIKSKHGIIKGFINWQGVLNNAQRLRGEELFLDLFDKPERCRHLFDVIRKTMLEASTVVQKIQSESGFENSFSNISNCLVNMISPEQYREYLLAQDIKIAERDSCFGLHNCAWNATPYLEEYAKIPYVAYIDMGINSDLQLAKKLFPNARRSLMYTPMDVKNKDIKQIREDLLKAASEYGPCDIVAADIESDTEDEKVAEFIRLCDEISRKYEQTVSAG
ncbi:Uroporphyrinogen decarboxylase (URO-D) [Sedimentisphaera cyanobacteriorum]|uniref:Uroporphyrinogen decarboxylase (URO-D) n=1 Tax=Sedimentisphaera cyanobacteriorum TaxID=1940790 RepID=A0A1Q2HQR2_9BACT|nr:hypothetical protein [Sedimentisphaera cyanobacteriorum]AQQ09681.1 Uroporphyrinogen decarboxylase (URO-D) [Sedimentisphaera cyanobacteriorum]